MFFSAFFCYLSSDFTHYFLTVTIIFLQRLSHIVSYRPCPLILTFLLPKSPYFHDHKVAISRKLKNLKVYLHI